MLLFFTSIFLGHEYPPLLSLALALVSNILTGYLEGHTSLALACNFRCVLKCTGFQGVVICLCCICLIRFIVN